MRPGSSRVASTTKAASPLPGPSSGRGAALAAAAVGPASAAAGGGLTGRLPEPQLLQVKWPGSSREERFARIDPASGRLRLRALRTGAARQAEGQAGSDAIVDFAQLSAARVEGAQVCLAGAEGDELLRMFCESAEHAQVWQRGIEDVAQLHGGFARAAAAPADGGRGRGGNSAEIRKLKDQCQRQEEQANQLEALNRRRDEQLLKLHSRLADALLVLQTGQSTYAEQQKLLEAQQARIDALQTPQAPPAESTSASKRDFRSTAEPMASASRISGGAGACIAEADMDDGPESGSDSPVGADTDAGEIAGLALRAEQLQRQLEDLTAASNGRAQGAGTVQSAAEQIAAASQVMTAAPQLLAHLHAMIAEKDALETQLRGEQVRLQQELQHLYSQVGSQGPIDEVDEDDGEDTSP